MSGGLVKRCALVPPPGAKRLEEGKYGVVKFVFSSSDAGEIGDVGPEGLDKSLVYSIQQGFLGYSPLFFEDARSGKDPHSDSSYQRSSCEMVHCGYIAWYETIKPEHSGYGVETGPGWYLLSRRPWSKGPEPARLCLAYLGNTGKSTWTVPQFDVGGVGRVSVDLMLHPVLARRWKPIQAAGKPPSRHTLMRTQPHVDLHGLKDQLGADFLDTLLNATSKILKVVTTVASIVSFLGLGTLALPKRVTPNNLGLDSEYELV